MKQFLTFVFLTLTLYLAGQPVNDNCSGAISLGNAPVCQTTVLYSNANATESNTGKYNYPPCFRNNPVRDVWFTFNAVSGTTDYRITVVGAPNNSLGIPAMKNPQIALYRGTCTLNGFELLDCETSFNGESRTILDIAGLTPGTYFLRVNDWAVEGTNAGAFNLCVVLMPPSETINLGGSTACSGYICDTGGPNGTYSNNEDLTYTICPTAPTKCIDFKLDYFEFESIKDVLTLYDGPNIAAPILGRISGGEVTKVNGGVAYQVTAKSGCLTLQFKSNGTATYGGFCGTWQCSSAPCLQYQPLTVNGAANPAEIAASVAAGKTKVSVKGINCPSGHFGTFLNGLTTDLELEKGMLLSTGKITDIPAPGSNFATTGLGFPGDKDLDAISRLGGSAELSLDACAVELEVFAATDELTFEYVFGSEEYPEFVGTPFNDIFAFLVSGPGIAGDIGLGDKKNIAKLANGTPIEINSVNQETNWQYFRNNEFGPSLVFDGLTADFLGKKNSLTARIKTVPCNTYLLKFVVGDRLDDQYDSGVLISDIKGGSPEVEVEFRNGLDYISESCSVLPDEVILSLNHPVTEPVAYRVKLGGTAVHGIDYQLNIPEFLTFTPSQPTFRFPITAVSDAIAEGSETILIQLTKDYGCGDMLLDELEIEIIDGLDVEILHTSKDTILVCKNGCIDLEASGASNYTWSPSSAVLSSPTSSNTQACPPSDGWVVVTGRSGSCTDKDSVFLKIAQPIIEIVPSSLTVCPGKTFSVGANNNVGNLQLKWQSSDIQLSQPEAQIQTLQASNHPDTLALIAGIVSGTCSVYDTVNVIVEGYEFPLLQKDTTICQNYSVALGSTLQNTHTIYNWTPSTGLSSSTVSGPIATPDASTTYRLIAQSQGGNCRDTGFVKINVIPADVTIAGRDTVFVCAGQSVSLKATSTTNGVGLNWFPKTNLAQVKVDSVVVNPKISTWYYAELTSNNCKVIDSVLVYVDSLPDLRITASPSKASYCQGEEVYLTSPTYEPAHFPNIKIQWLQPLEGSQTPDSFLNLVFYATLTNTYTRVTTVNACKSVDSIVIKVIPPGQIQVQPDTTLCQGASVKFKVTANPAVKDYKWEPANGLSCTECKEPGATPLQTTTYSVKGELEGCPVSGGITVNVTPLPVYQFPSRTTVCPGEQVTLNQFSDPSSTYSWTSSNNTLNSSNPRPVVTPAVTTTYFLNAVNKGCPVSAQVTLTVVQDYTVPSIADTAVCRGATVKLTARPSKQGVAYNWRNQTGTFLSSLPDLTVVPATTSTYYLTVSDQNPTCFTKRDTIVVTVNPVPSITKKEVKEVGKDTADIFEGEQYTLNITASAPSIPGAKYEWFYLGNSIGNSQTGNFGPLTAPDVETDQKLTYGVLITNQFGCAFFDTIQVLVKDNPVRIPNVFTPNGDLINNTFKIISRNPVEIIEFKVWNRWGQLVYNNTNGLEGWDGNHKGSPAPADVYVYYIKYRIPGTQQEPKVLRGDVTLLR